MKRFLLVLLICILFYWNAGRVNPHPEGLKSINEPDLGFLSHSFNTSKQGVYELATSIKNTRDPAIKGEVPISWDKCTYELQLSEGAGTLSESVADFDLNGDGDIADTFAVAWNNTIRPWDAVIDGVYIYALADHSENRGFNRTYYINGEPKIFQLGNKKHTLYFAENDLVFLDSMLLLSNIPVRTLNSLFTQT